MERAINDRLSEIEASLRSLAEAQSRSNDLMRMLVDSAREPGDDGLVTVLEKIQIELAAQTTVLKRLPQTPGPGAAVHPRKPPG